jgi:formamidopyrimidine-DNA glycosylase
MLQKVADAVEMRVEELARIVAEETGNAIRTQARPEAKGAADILRYFGGLASELKGEKKSNLAVHGRTGQKCPVCGDVVREVSFADSSLQYCPTGQTGGKPLADRRMSKLLK